MNKTKLIIATSLFGLVQLDLNAQQTLTTASGNASCSGGLVSFSIGQVVYTTNLGTIGSVAQGVQQLFKIQTVLGLDNDNPEINLSFALYPNPTIDKLNISLGENDFSKTSYQLFTLNGKLLADKKNTCPTTNIKMERFPQAVYLLNATNDKKIVKTYK